mgnify:FL=1
MTGVRPNIYFSCAVGILLSFSMSAMAMAMDQSAEKALAQLMSDVENIQIDSLNKKEDKATHYKTQYGDTLDQIIIDYLPNLPVRTSMLKRVIVHTNPHAFKRSNPNWMYSGRKLKLPDPEDIRDLIFTDAAQEKMSRGQDRDSWIRFP